MKRVRITIIPVLIILLTTIEGWSQVNPSKSKGSKPIQVSLTAAHFKYDSGNAEFTQYKERSALRINKSEGQVILRDFSFADGIIEFDFEPIDPRFASVYFRYADKDENELFYFRTERADKKDSEDAVQYAPVIKGINTWDLLYHFQSHANFKKGEWNHVKLVVSGKQMRAFVNDMTKPVLKVPKLEGDVTKGTIAFEGQMIVSNLTLKPGETEGLDPVEGVDETESDRRYLRSWEVSEPFETVPGTDFSFDYLPKDQAKWTPIQTERMGLVNLTRAFGGSGKRRMVWLRTTIHSTSKQTKKLDFGFSDEVWVGLNGKFLYVDKNLYFHPIRKEPQGRCSVENSSFDLPLNEGANTLLVGVSNDFYGWGIIARLNSLEGIGESLDK